MDLTPPRYFNKIIDFGEYYLKLSTNTDKILAEVEFYKSIPTVLKDYYPEIDYKLEYIEDQIGYRVKKIPVPDASHFYVAGDEHSYKYFEKVFEKLSEYFDLCPFRNTTKLEIDTFLAEEVIQKDLSRLQLIKNLPEAIRLEKILKKAGFTDFDNYLEIIHQAFNQIHHEKLDYKLAFSHGDMCLSNLLFHENQLLLIDPKGCLPGSENLRSPYYDYAKLSQCFYGNYDHINLLKFEGHKSNNRINALFNDFCIQQNIDQTYMTCFQATFFFSMIPLHSESALKMEAFLVSSIDTWKKYLNR